MEVPDLAEGRLLTDTREARDAFQRSVSLQPADGHLAAILALLLLGIGVSVSACLTLNQDCVNK